MTNAERLRYVVEMELDGYEIPPAYRGLSFHAAQPGPAEVTFREFVQRVERSLGRTYLPIYRMADGEFSFIVGWRRPVGVSTGLVRSLWRRLRQAFQSLGRSGIRTIWGEAYRGRDARAARRTLETSLAKVASRGIVAAYFARRGDRWGEQYLEPVWRWLDERGITLGERNYVPFYFVYALLSGPSRRVLLEGRRVLVVTSLTPGRQAGIERGLLAEGVKDLQFLPISSDRSMLDRLDLSGVRPVDLALVAAGIGSVNVLVQLEPLGVPAIDCGIGLECFIDPARRTERPFLLHHPTTGTRELAR